ncbi:hypothetical protein CPC08DRAFT_722252 [Agrocybe pediades]|nr:hypothetical protein CPC08DRAFT_722252 [Agrocybe pediades]
MSEEQAVPDDDSDTCLTANPIQTTRSLMAPTTTPCSNTANIWTRTSFLARQMQTTRPSKPLASLSRPRRCISTRRPFQTTMNFYSILHDAREFALGVHRRNQVLDTSTRFDPYLRKDVRTISFWTKREIHKFGQSSVTCRTRSEESKERDPAACLQVGRVQETILTIMNFHELLHDACEFQGVYRRNKLIDSSTRFDPYLRRDRSAVPADHWITGFAGFSEATLTGFLTLPSGPSARSTNSSDSHRPSTRCRYEVVPTTPCSQQLHGHEDAAEHMEQAHGVRRARNGTQSRVCKWDGRTSVYTTVAYARGSLSSAVPQL